MKDSLRNLTWNILLQYIGNTNGIQIVIQMEHSLYERSLDEVNEIWENPCVESPKKGIFILKSFDNFILLSKFWNIEVHRSFILVSKISFRRFLQQEASLFTATSKWFLSNACLIVCSSPLGLEHQQCWCTAQTNSIVRWQRSQQMVGDFNAHKTDSVFQPPEVHWERHSKPSRVDVVRRELDPHSPFSFSSLPWSFSSLPSTGLR